MCLQHWVKVRIGQSLALDTQCTLLVTEKDGVAKPLKLVRRVRGQNVVGAHPVQVATRRRR
eukprot:7611164-Pyramimonas_sp.AAC.1